MKAQFEKKKRADRRNENLWRGDSWGKGVTSDDKETRKGVRKS